MYTNSLSNLRDGLTLSKQEGSPLAKGLILPSGAGVFGAMCGIGNGSQVVRVVVELVAIKVVHMLTWCERATKLLLHYVAMFFDTPAMYVDDAIALAVDAATVIPVVVCTVVAANGLRAIAALLLKLGLSSWAERFIAHCAVLGCGYAVGISQVLV